MAYLPTAPVLVRKCSRLAFSVVVIFAVGGAALARDAVEDYIEELRQRPAASTPASPWVVFQKNLSNAPDVIDVNATSTQCFRCVPQNEPRGQVGRCVNH